MSVTTILIVVLILILIGAIPGGPLQHNWGYMPAGVIGTILIVLLILVLIGRL